MHTNARFSRTSERNRCVRLAENTDTSVHVHHRQSFEFPMAVTMQGLASIAILPSGAVSGHFVDSQTSQCFGLYGTQISCERECSRGEDYKLIDLSIMDFRSKKEVQIIVESHGQDAARFQNAVNVHGWEEDVMQAVHYRKEKDDCLPQVRFECEILKADEEAEKHVIKYLPSLAGRGAIVNIGTMHIKGLKFDRTDESQIVESTTVTTDVNQDDHDCHTEKGISSGDNFVDESDKLYTCSGHPSLSGLRSEVGSCLTNISRNKELNDIFEEELDAEGLPKQGFVLTRLREKTIHEDGEETRAKCLQTTFLVHSCPNLPSE